MTNGFLLAGESATLNMGADIGVAKETYQLEWSKVCLLSGCNDFFVDGNFTRSLGEEANLGDGSLATTYGSVIMSNFLLCHD
jgi:hypothetical protein